MTKQNRPPQSSEPGKGNPENPNHGRHRSEVPTEKSIREGLQRYLEYRPTNGTYTPSDDGNAAKIWELLRRNPTLRNRAERLLNVAESESSHHRKIVDRYIRCVERQNPLASYVLRWLFRSGRYELGFNRPEHSRFRRWTPEDQVCENLGLSENRVLECEFLGLYETYCGPLRMDSGDFHFGVEWPRTPPTFRYQFEWLCSEFEVGLQSFFEKSWLPDQDGTLPTRHVGRCEIDIDMEKNSDPGLAKIELEFYAKLFQTHVPILIPKGPITKAETVQLRELVDKEIGLIVEQYGIMPTRKIPFGAPNSWRLFSFFSPGDMSYDKDKANPRKYYSFERKGIIRRFRKVHPLSSASQSEAYGRGFNHGW